jgi:hypothetical protein
MDSIMSITTASAETKKLVKKLRAARNDEEIERKAEPSVSSVTSKQTRELIRQVRATPVPADLLGEARERFEKEKELAVRALLRPDMPPCFPNSDRWVIWRLIELQAAAPQHSGYCSDCTREYQHEMKLQERCTRPDVVFDVDEDGWSRGLTPEGVEVEAQRAHMVKNGRPRMPDAQLKRPRFVRKSLQAG